jgi:hypothetical protein
MRSPELHERNTDHNVGCFRRPPSAWLRINTDFALFLLCGAPHNRKNWLFAGSARAGERAAAIMSLIATARANGHEPHAWLTDVLTRLPTTLDRDIGDLLPHTWKPSS